VKAFALSSRTVETGDLYSFTLVERKFKRKKVRETFENNTRNSVIFGGRNCKLRLPTGAYLFVGKSVKRFELSNSFYFIFVAVPDNGVIVTNSYVRINNYNLKNYNFIGKTTPV